MGRTYEDGLHTLPFFGGIENGGKILIVQILTM